MNCIRVEKSGRMKKYVAAKKRIHAKEKCRRTKTEYQLGEQQSRLKLERSQEAKDLCTRPAKASHQLAQPNFQKIECGLGPATPSRIGSWFPALLFVTAEAVR
jgi:hypothetical protein